MTLVVPFDGSELSKVALVRAAQFETVLNEGIVAVSVIPDGNARYARERGWLDAGEAFDADRIADGLRESVAEIHPEAAFHHVVVDHYAPRGTIARELRQFAREHDANVVFLGSENAGRITSGFTVGRSVAADGAYDTMIVSARRPSNSARLEEVKPTAEVLR
jgi:nucleotide-binding universal stress UspA family protein